MQPLAGLERVPTRTVSLGYKPWRMLIWLGQLARIPFNRLVPGAELFHATEHLLMPLRGVPTVLTVHDLIFRRYPAHHKPLNRWYLNLTMPLYCRRASHIIAVSEQTKRDVMEAYGMPGRKDHGDLRGGRPELHAAERGSRRGGAGAVRPAAALPPERRHHRAAQEPGPRAGGVRAAARRGAGRRVRDRRQEGAGCTTTSLPSWSARRPGTR